MHRVVIVGGGFGGLYAARRLGREPVAVTLVDRRNFHVFQPLLYQVATGGLSPADISAPLRSVLKRQRRTRVVLAEVQDVEVERNRVSTSAGALDYDTLIVATGVGHDYFGNDAWAAWAPGLKTVEDATRIRSRVLRAFEDAECENDPAGRRALMTFAVVGGGPTGVELAGAIGELAQHTLRRDFRRIRPGEAQVLLVEGVDRILPGYPPRLSAAARRSLERLGVTVETGTRVSHVGEGSLRLVREGRTREIRAATILWAAGVRASSLSRVLAERAGAELDRAGRVQVEADCTIRGHPEIMVIGDLARFPHQPEYPQGLPGVAPVAMQQGAYAARRIADRLRGRTTAVFRYRNRGNLAVIGRAAAVADLGPLRFSGYPAWLLWLFVHIMHLVEFENRLLVFIQWAFSYFTKKRGARLITGQRD
jgi:NADH dehydrogenase